MVTVFGCIRCQRRPMAAGQNLQHFRVGFYTRSGANCSAVGSAQQYQGSLRWGIGSRLGTPVATSAKGSLGVVSLAASVSSQTLGEDG